MSQMSGGTSTRNAGERSKTIITVAVDSILAHPLNVKVYGSVDWTTAANKEFLASIQTRGVDEPIVYTRLSFDKGESYANYVVSGHRRLEAAKKLGLRKVAARILGDTTGRHDAEMLLFAEQYLFESNRQRVKTVEQKAREFKELKRIEAELAKQRRLTSLKQGEKKPVVENLPPRETGKARDKAAETLGLSGRTAEKLEKIVDAADAGNPKAAAALAEIDRKKGRGVDTAYRAVVQPAAPKPPKDPELVAKIQAHEKATIELKGLLKKNGIDADVQRSKSDGKFHVIWRDVTAEQVHKFAETFKS